MRLPNVEDRGCKVLTTGGWIPQERIEEHNRVQKEAVERQYTRQRTTSTPKGTCPFSSAMNPACKTDCALFCAGDCAMHRLGAKANSEAIESRKSSKCPFSGRTCEPSCALNVGGVCVIVNLTKAENSAMNERMEDSNV